jgi:hypothetical protein
MDHIVLGWRSAMLNPAQVRALERGQPLYFQPNAADGARCRAYDRDGNLIGLLRFKQGLGWRPFKSFATLDKAAETSLARNEAW